MAKGNINFGRFIFSTSCLFDITARVQLLITAINSSKVRSPLSMKMNGFWLAVSIPLPTEKNEKYKTIVSEIGRITAHVIPNRDCLYFTLTSLYISVVISRLSLKTLRKYKINLFMKRYTVFA